MEVTGGDGGMEGVNGSEQAPGGCSPCGSWCGWSSVGGWRLSGSFGLGILAAKGEAPARGLRIEGVETPDVVCPCDGLGKHSVSSQPLIQLEGLLLHQQHLRHGRVQGIEQQIAALRHHHRGQHQAQLLASPQPVATNGSVGLAMGY
jgi:hypothetical protein